MKAWSFLLNSWTSLPPMQRGLLCLAVIAGALLMTVYVHVLQEHVARAGQLRLGQRTTATQLAAAAAALPHSAGTSRLRPRTLSISNGR